MNRVISAERKPHPASSFSITASAGITCFLYRNCTIYYVDYYVGSSWSNLKATLTCKEFLASRRGKIGSISEVPEGNDTEGSESTQLPQQPRYIKKDLARNSSKLKRSPTGRFEQVSDEKLVATENSATIIVNPRTDYIKREDIMGIKLYAVSDGPPTRAVLMALKYLEIDFELVNVDFVAGEHLTPDFLQKNPQGELPLLVDNGFMLSESVAILQYLADKYKKDETFYPVDPKERAVVNHRLAFHLSTLYKSIWDYLVMMAPACYAYAKTEENLKKFLHAFKIFEEFLKRGKSEYVAGGNLTIADLSMVMDLVCVEALGDYDLTLTAFPLVKTWYEGFKSNQPDLWSVANAGLLELTEFGKNPPDLSSIQHPIHPTDKAKLK